MGFENLTSQPGDVGEGSTFPPSVSWGRNVKIGANCHLGPNVVLHDNVQLGDHSHVGPNVSLGEPAMGFYKRSDYQNAPTSIGAGALIRTGTVIGCGCTLGDNFQTGPYVTIRENTRIGKNCSIGNQCDLQYEVEIGDFTRLHSFVTVGSGTRIGPYCWIHPFVVFTNDRLFPTFVVSEPPVVAPFCVIAVHCTVLPATRLGVHVVAGASSEIRGEVPSFSFLKGNPAERVIDARKMVAKKDGKPFLPYPWLRHVDRDYPWKDVPPAERRVEDYVPKEWQEFL